MRSGPSSNDTLNLAAEEVLPFASGSKRLRRSAEAADDGEIRRVPVGLYTRLSRNRGGEITTGLKRQRDETKPWAASRGYEIVQEYQDDDTSAFRLSQARTGFEQLLADLENGRIRGVVCWKLDRLVRRTLDWARVLPKAEDTPWFVASFADGVNTQDPMGRLLAGILVSMAELEAANIRTRTIAKHDELAREGKWSGGGNRAFGHTADRKDIVPEEAELIREAARRVIAGEPLRAIAADFAARGVVGPGTKKSSGGPMPATVWRRILLSPRMVGKRGVSQTRLSAAQGMAPILDEETNRQVWRILSRPSGSAHFATATQPGNARRHLLTGFLVCSHCKAMLKPWRMRGEPAFACLKVPGSSGCGGTTILSNRIEPLIVEFALQYLSRLDLSAYVADDDVEGERILADIRREEAKLEDLSIAHWDTKSIDDHEYWIVRARIDARLTDLRRKLGRRRPAVPWTQGSDVRRAWDTWNLHERRAALRLALEPIVVLPGFAPRAAKEDGSFPRGRPTRRLAPKDRIVLRVRPL